MAMVWRPDKIQGVDGIDRKAYRKGGEIEGTDVEGGTDHSVDGTGVEISRKAYLKALTLKEAQRKEKLKAHPLKYKAYRLKYSQSEKGKAIIKKWEKSDNGKASRKKTDKKRGQSDKRKAYRLKYRQSEKGKAIIKKWQKSDNGKAMRKKTDKKYVQSAGGKVAQKAAQKKYAQSAKAKAAQKKYAQSAKAKAARKLWEKSDNRKASRKKYQQSAKGKAARKAASRKFAQALHPRARNAILIQAGLADIKSQAKTRAAKKAIKVTEKKMKSQFRRKEIITSYHKMVQEKGKGEAMKHFTGEYRKKVMEAGRSLSSHC